MDKSSGVFWRFLTSLALIPTVLATGALAQDDLARELPRIKALDPAAALRSFKIHPGFHLEPVAIEPLITDPVSVCYDADGRLYVVEMRGYPYPEKMPSGNVTLLEDRDGDGKFDKRSIFVDALSWPTGVVPYDGGVFIAVAPDVIYAKDTNGDGVADLRKVMFSGFGTDNVQGLVNGLLWGPDGWIYGVTSSNGGEIRNHSRPGSKPVSVRGRDFRFKPDGSAFEAISGGGQFGHAFDDWGHRFTCSNSNHIRQIVLPSQYLERNPALVPPPVVADIAAEGPAATVFRISSAEPWRLVRTRQRAADPEMRKKLPPTELVPIGFFTSATGVTIYRGSTYPPEYRGNAFIGDVGGNLVHRKVMAISGATYRASRADQKVEFLASTDNWFRPVNFANTPDGSLLILDMYRETIEHPWSIPEPIKKHLDLTSGKDLGRLYNLVHDGAHGHRSPRLGSASTPELVTLLADPDAWWRETAQRLLIERRDTSAVPLLKSLVSLRPTPLGRVHALWTLDVLGSLGSEDLATALRDLEPRVLEQAVRLAGPRLKHDRAILESVLPLAESTDSLVRFQAALSLGEINTDHRSIEALAKIAVKDAGDPYLRAAVLSSVAGHASDLIEVLARRPGFLATAFGQGFLGDLASLVGAEKDSSQVHRLLGRLIEDKLDLEVLARVVLEVGRGLGRSGGSLGAILSGDLASRVDALAVESERTAVSKESTERRLTSIALVGMMRPDGLLKIAPELLEARQPVPVQLAALQALSGLPDRRVGATVVERWKTMSPAVRREAAEVLFGRPERIGDLITALESKALTAAEIDPGRIKQLRGLADLSLRGRAMIILGTGADSGRDRDRTIRAYRAALDQPGRRDKGREVFLKACATCHRAEGQGIEVGPDLATVTARPAEDLLVHILDPNREVAPNFLNYNIAMTDGRVVSGIIAAESAASLTLKRAEGAGDVVPRSQIEAVSSTGMSLMPEGLEKGLTPSDLANLIGFVKSIGKPAEPAATSSR